MALTLFDNIGTDLTPELEKKISTFISCLKRYSISNPVPSKKIEQGMKLSGVQVRALVRFCRRMEYPVGSSGRGYFWIRNSKELEKTLQHLQERKQSLETTISEMQTIRLYLKNSPLSTN